MLRYFVFVALQLVILQVSAQRNGEILEKTQLNGFEELLAYIKATEERDSTGLNKERFRYFDSVMVSGITYWSDGLKVKGFLLQPKNTGKYRTLIYNRGGSLEHGSLTHNAASIGLGELARIAYEGYFIAASQYRGNGGGEGKEEYGGSDINDVLNLIPLLQDQPSADLSRLGIFGWSRGAMTTFLTLKRTNKVKAVVLGGPSTNLTRSIIDRPLLDEWWSAFIPDYNVNKAEVLKKRSAIYWVHELPENVPMLLLQGENDKGLLPDYTLDFAKELTRHKRPYRLIKFEEGSHSLKEYREEVYTALFLWFEKYLN